MFENKAIECENWEQMEHLLSIARDNKVQYEGVSKVHFDIGAKFFAQYVDSPDTWSNFYPTNIDKDSVISYAAFLASITPQPNR
jgi:hypothetical protein